jgi:hypothetical protein
MLNKAGKPRALGELSSWDGPGSDEGRGPSGTRLMAPRPATHGPVVVPDQNRCRWGRPRNVPFGHQMQRKQVKNEALQAEHGYADVEGPSGRNDNSSGAASRAG